MKSKINKKLMRESSRGFRRRLVGRSPYSERVCLDVPMDNCSLQVVVQNVFGLEFSVRHPITVASQTITRIS